METLHKDLLLITDQTKYLCVQSVWSVQLIEWVLTWRALLSVCESRLQCGVEHAHPLSFTHSVTTFTSLRTHFKDCHCHMCARQSITYQIHQRTHTTFMCKGFISQRRWQQKNWTQMSVKKKTRLKNPTHTYLFEVRGSAPLDLSCIHPSILCHSLVLIHVNSIWQNMKTSSSK